MSLLVRKINKAKWQVTAGEYALPASADSITLCLKTSRNTLSFWLIDSLELIDEAVLAIVSANDNLDTIDVVVIPEQYFTDNEFKVVATDGITGCKDLVDTHRDLEGLNIKHLDALSERVVDALRNKSVIRYSLGKLKVILKDAIEKGRMSAEDLKEGVRNKIG
ncbi:MAG: hypothetical protein ACI9EB_001718 [Pseudomonas sp.]|jgi:hypothetical protein